VVSISSSHLVSESDKNLVRSPFHDIVKPNKP